MQAKTIVAAGGVCLLAAFLSAPGPAAAGPQGRVVVVNTESDTVTLIDSGKPEVIEDIPVGDHPTELALDGRQTTAYVISTGSNLLSIIDLRTRDVLDVPLGFEPSQLTVTPDGKLAVMLHKDRDVAAGGKNFLGDYSIYDVKKGKQVNNYLYGPSPGSNPQACALAVNPEGKFLWITSCADDTVVMIDLKKALDDNSGDEVRGIVDTQDDPRHVAVTGK
jgi:YVTN family beta-propeller protein